jgi:hypothetical protein
VFFLLVHVKPAETERKPIRAKLQSLDAFGFVLFASSITMLLLALQWGGIEHPWSSSVIVGLLVGFGVVMLLFIFWTLRQKENALIPPRLFTVNRNPALLCAAAFFVNGPFQVIIYWLPVWFQGVLGASPTQSGINFFPTVVSDVLAAFVGSAIVAQLGWWNPFLLLAEVCVCLCGGLLTTIYPDVPGSRWVGFQILGGVGYSLASNLVGSLSLPFWVLMLTLSLVTPRHAVLASPRPCPGWLINAAFRHIDKLLYFHGNWPGSVSEAAPSEPRWRDT